MDDQERTERYMLRPMVYLTSIGAGMVVGTGAERVHWGLIALGVALGLLFAALAEVYFRSAGQERVAIKKQVSAHKKRAASYRAWADRWRSIAMGEGDPWDRKGKQDA